MAVCRKRRLYQALSVLSLSLGFSPCLLFCELATFCVGLFCVICAFCLLVVLVRLSVPVQVIDWKKIVPEMTYNVLVGTLNATHVTHVRRTEVERRSNRGRMQLSLH